MMELLKEHHLVHSWIGLLHTLIALLATLFGTLVFLNRKGTVWHKGLGYAFAVSMLVVNLSAFGLYNLSGNFGVFHGFALISLFSVSMGMLAAIRRKKSTWLKQHFYYMNWSVVGLYCAFWSEVGTRLFDMRYFWWMVALATFATAMVGNVLIQREAKKLSL